ncbi:MAG: DUF6057 family protein [Tannerellaceae bacterium]|jgi:hypothetical protein|nr:DUF6057 family protein [Tannerellaceae bacterium]
MMKYRYLAGGMALFLILCTLYLWIGVNPALYLIKGYREFYADLFFLKRFLDFPGYPAEYLSRWLTQFYVFPLLASAGISLLLCGIYALGLGLFKGYKPYGMAFVPPALLLYMHTLYEHSILFDLQVFGLLLFLFLFLRSFRLRPGLPLAVFPLALAAVFYLYGLIVAGVFVVAAFSGLVFRKEKGARLLVFAAEALAVWLVFRVLFALSVHDLSQEFVDAGRVYSFRYWPFVLYLSVCLLPLGGRRLERLMLPASLAALVACICFTFNRDEKNGLSVQHYALNEQWERVLEYAALCEYPDKDAVLYTNQALYHTGKLCDELFLYNQSMGSKGLLSAEISNYSEILPNQSVFLQLGALSLSIVWGTEATNVYGANPYVLKNLAKAYLAGGYTAEAKKVLNLLSRIPFQKQWVEQYQALVGDSLYQQAQAPLAVVSRQSAMANLYLLVQDSHLNRMAYDYLLTGLLLDNRIDHFAAALEQLKAYGYTSIPKLYMEGLVYHSLYAARAPINIQEFDFDADVLYRFESFAQDLSYAQQNPTQTREWLANKHGDTYWYYILFQSPISEEERRDAFLRITR